MAGSLRESESGNKQVEPGLLRSQPYRLYFPAGILLCWVGVLPWLLQGLGWGQHGNAAGHSIVQIQGFMLLFAQGFLFTMVPRQTRTAAPGVGRLVFGLVGTLVVGLHAVWVTTAGRPEDLASSQMLWFLVIASLLQFIWSRRAEALREGRVPLPGLVCIPMALGFGVIGSLLFAVYGMLGQQPAYLWLHFLGKLFLLQGMFLGLILGLAGLVLPVMTGTQGRALSTRQYLGLMLLLVASFLLEVFAVASLGLVLRALVVAVGLVWGGGIGRRPGQAGWNRFLIWLAAWALPLGILFSAGLGIAGLHLAFMAGFALMALAVGLHVSLAHAGRKAWLDSLRGPVLAYAGLIGLALGARLAMSWVQPEQYGGWMALSAGSFLAATLVWSCLAAPGLLRRPV